MNTLATVLFTLAVVHTFAAGWINQKAARFREGSCAENILHFLGEVELIFGIWAMIYLLCFGFKFGSEDTTLYLGSISFVEPLFVFVIMTLSASKPIIELSSSLILKLTNILPFKKGISFYFVALGLAPLFGSLITEPASMTVIALILANQLFSKPLSVKLKYATLGLLFVHVSIGGALTHFAAPPVLMVAKKWNLDLLTLFTNFGLKAIAACMVSTFLVILRFKKELSTLKIESSRRNAIPLWVKCVHVVFISLTVYFAHTPVALIALFVLFLGWTRAAGEYQDELKVKEAAMVAAFLAGLVILGTPQSWWLEPIISKFDSWTLYLSAISLTAIVDNAALTFLGSQVNDLSDASRYALLSGALIGGGLTVIANAPNPAGYSILNRFFDEEGIRPLKLFGAALGPTLIAALIFWVFHP